MEHIKINTPESSGNKPEQLSGKEKLEAVLALFGTDTARETFIETCRKYIEARDKAVHESYAPEAAIRRRAVISSPKQAKLHNAIMDTLTRLATQSQTASPLQREILIEMHNREVTAKIIREYIASSNRNTAPEEEEEEEGWRKKGMSDTAYYHSLGKEH